MNSHPERSSRPAVDATDYSAHVQHTFEAPISPAFGEERGKVLCVLDIRESGVQRSDDDPAWEGALSLTHNGMEMQFFSHLATLPDTSAATDPQTLLGLISPKISVDFWTQIRQAGNDRTRIHSLIQGLFSDLG